MIFVTGGTGLLGSHLLKYLSETGRHTLAIKRRNSIIPDFLQKLDIEWVEGDLFDLDLIEKCIERSEVIIHTAAIVTFSTRNLDLLYKTNVEGTKHLINYSLEKPNKYFIHISSVAALGRDNENLNLNETATWSESDGNTNYARSKHLAEIEVWRGIEEGLQAAIINPSVIIGEGDIHKSSGILFKRISKNSSYYPTGSGNFVDVNDVIQSIGFLLENRKSGERYILNNSSLKNKTLYSTIAKHLNKSLPKKEISKKALHFLKPIENLFSWLTFKQPEISEDVLKLIGTNYTYDNTKSINELGVKYTPIESTLQRVSKYYLDKYIQ